MKAVVFFAFAALCWSQTGARIVPKCELRQLLNQSLSGLPEAVKQSGLTGDNFVAKLVCHADLGANLNTSAVTKLTRGEEDRQGHGGDSSGGRSRENSSNGKSSEETGRGKRGRKQRHAGFGSSQEEDKDVTLYGLFQLLGDVVCYNGTVSEATLCNVDCSALIDDDLTDDITCVLTLLSNIVQNGFKAPNLKQLWGVVKQILQEDCKSIDPLQYFAECL